MATFIDVLNNPEGRRLVESLEYIGNTKDNRLKNIRKNLKKELKIKFNYTYRD